MSRPVNSRKSLLSAWLKLLIRLTHRFQLPTPAQKLFSPGLGSFVLLTLLATANVQAQSPAALPVGVVQAEKQPIARSAEFVGRIEAPERVDVRARVTGYLEAVLFKEGDRIKEGDPLFRIEQGPFQAAVQQAQGALLRAQSEYTNANLQAQRAQELVKTSAASVAERDKRVAQEKSAQGDVVTAGANLRTAQINLGYTVINSPINGIVGKANVTRGNLVGPDTGVLTTVISQDPMYVTFPVSQRAFLDLRRGEFQSGEKKAGVTLRFADGSAYDHPGLVNFLDIAVDRGTDTVAIRAMVANPRGQLIDGQLVRVSVVGDKPEEKVLVPQAALLADQQGTYLFIAQEGKAEVRRVKVAGEKGADAVLDGGLSGGEQVIVQGVESLRPGAAVTASPITPALSRS